MASRAVEQLGLDGGFDFHLRQEIDDVAPR
jgi:hypothetical protein